MAVDQNFLYLYMSDPDHEVIVQLTIPELTFIKEVTITDMNSITCLIADTTCLYLCGKDATGQPMICKKDKTDFHTVNGFNQVRIC